MMYKSYTNTYAVVNNILKLFVYKSLFGVRESAYMTNKYMKNLIIINDIRGYSRPAAQSK